MASEADFPGWDWQDPDGLADRMFRMHEDLARCRSLVPTAVAEPYPKGQLVELGIRGIEFAAWKTLHPAGLATDAIPLRGPEEVSRPGRLYRVDGEAYFVELDLRHRLPFEAGCLDWAYAEHLLEHLPVPVAIGWLREVRRVLAPGGLLRLTTPDLHRYAESYLRGDGFFAAHRQAVHAAGLGPPMPARAAFMVNQIFYHYGHRWIYDLAEVAHVLTEAGFDPAAVRRRGFREGALTDVAALDRAVRRDETLYVEVTA